MTLHLSFLGGQAQAGEHGDAGERMREGMREALERLDRVALQSG